MEKLERREDVDAYVRSLVYSLCASDSPVFEDLVERETEYLTQVTSLGEKKIRDTYRVRISKASILRTISHVQANIEEPTYPVIEGSDEWYEFHDSVMNAFQDHESLELEWWGENSSSVMSTDDLVQKFSR